MSTGSCLKKDCTVSNTGICLELYNPIETCPNFIDEEGDEVVDIQETTESSDVIPQRSELPNSLKLQPKVVRRFHPGSELGLKDAVDIMRSRYTHLIGILGETDAGKTAFISSLYIMASKGYLHPAYSFAGSLTLQGFEDRVRGIREWENGRLAEEFSSHTQLADPRSPSFMHLCLQELKNKNRRIELLLTDLPGEWSSDLIKRVEKAFRFDFLGRADGIILFIDGPLLNSAESQHIEVQKAKILLARLANLSFVDRETPFVLLVSKCDELNMQIPYLAEEIQNEAISLGFNPKLLTLRKNEKKLNTSKLS